MIIEVFIVSWHSSFYFTMVYGTIVINQQCMESLHIKNSLPGSIFYCYSICVIIQVHEQMGGSGMACQGLIAFRDVLESRICNCWRYFNDLYKFVYPSALFLKLVDSFFL